MRSLTSQVLEWRNWRLTWWEVVLYPVLFLYIVSPSHPYLWYIFPGVQEGFRTATIGFFGTELYFLNDMLLTILIFSILLLAFRHMQGDIVLAPPYVVYLFSALFASMYSLDIFLSRAPVYEYATLSVVFLPLVIWLFVLFSANSLSALRLLKATALFVALQGVYGVLYYATGREQFYTPHFGARTGGTLETPNNLYVVALMGVPLQWCLMWGSRSVWQKGLWCACLVITSLALTFTYTRTGWLAVIPVLLWLAFHPHSCVSTRASKRIVVLVCATLLAATIFVRTGGNYLGNPQDRSFHGRFAIWEVALKVYTLHPWIGNGLNTYRWLQGEMMTRKLASFGPGNVEPKNLYLHLLVEFGMVGLVLFVATMAGYVWLIRRRLPEMPCDEFRCAVTGCYMAVVAILLAGFGDTPVLQFQRLAPSLVFAVAVACGTVLVGGPLPSLVSGAKVKQPHSPLGTALRILLLVLLTLSLVVLYQIASGYLEFHRLQNTIPTYRTRNPDRPRFTPLTQIAPTMQHALIASEDGYFYQHHGVDWQALHRALRVNIRNLRFKQGGSTITMQTARYLLLGREKTLSRKIAEILLALEMERTLSKARILELYLNSARFGLGAQDIGTACAVYFGKKPSELSLGEAAFLAGVLPEPPRGREELTPEKVERCKHRALGRLAHFFSRYYSPAQIERAYRERITFVWQKGEQSGR